jgi:hypothetical protein
MRLPITTGNVREKTKVIALRLTPDEKAGFENLIRSSGFSNFQQAFDAWLKSVSQSEAKTLDEQAYFMKMEQADEIAKRLGLRKIKVLANIYKTLAGSMGYDPTRRLVELLDPYEAVLRRMMQAWNGDLRDLILFKSLLALWKDLKQRELVIRSAQLPASDAALVTPGHADVQQATSSEGGSEQ